MSPEPPVGSGHAQQVQWPWLARAFFGLGGSDTSALHDHPNQLCLVIRGKLRGMGWVHEEVTPSGGVGAGTAVRQTPMSVYAAGCTGIRALTGLS